MQTSNIQLCLSGVLYIRAKLHFIIKFTRCIITQYFNVQITLTQYICIRTIILIYVHPFSCKDNQNMNSFFAIVMGLSNIAVSRLSQTWEVRNGREEGRRGMEGNGGEWREGIR